MAAVSCDARSGHVSERYVHHAISQIRAALFYIARGEDVDLAVKDIRFTLNELEFTAWSGMVRECGWTGDVPSPNSWTCPQCRTRHPTTEETPRKDE